MTAAVIRPRIPLPPGRDQPSILLSAVGSSSRRSFTNCSSKTVDQDALSCSG
jgi:hypothetical protein